MPLPSPAPPAVSLPAAAAPEVEQPLPPPPPPPGPPLPTAPAKPAAPVLQQTPIVPPLPERAERQAALASGAFVPGELLVLVPSGDRDRLHRLVAQEGWDLAETAHLPTVDLIAGRYRLSEGNDLMGALDEAALALEGRKGFVQLNHYFEAQGVAESPPYHVSAIRADAAQRLATGRGVTIALLDTPVDVNHPAYRGRVREDRRVVGHEPPGAHGTALAGVIAQVAPEGRTLSIPVCRAEPGRPVRSTSFLLARGLDLALRWGVQGINLSLGGPRDRLVGLLVEEALKRKTILVAAAGNKGPKGKAPYPAAHPGVIAVTAIDHRDRIDPRATRGPHVSLSAPGVDIVTAAPGGGRQVATGTSVAAAQVSGVAALLLERHPDAAPSSVKQLLESSARDLGPPGKDPVYGAGRVDALRALEALLAAKPQEGRREP